MIETAKARKAYEDYYNLGPGRSLDKLCEVYRGQPKAEVPTRRRGTLGKWSVEHRWPERVLGRDAEIALAQFEELKRLATQTDYAIYQLRILDLNKLAKTLFEEIQEESKRWLLEPKGIGSGRDGTYERVEIMRFNAPLVEQFRKTLDDIALEMGERVKGIRLSGDVELRDMEAVRRQRWEAASEVLKQAMADA